MIIKKKKVDNLYERNNITVKLFINNSISKNEVYSYNS